MSEKIFVSPDELLRDSFELAGRIHRSGFRPDVVLVLWRGGTPVGIVVHEFLLFKGVETYHTVVKAESYTSDGRHTEPRVDSLEPLRRRLTADTRVLVVDDIFDTGRTLWAVREALRTRTEHIRIATLYLRQGHNETGLTPDFFLRETDRWVVFPHELMGLSPAELGRKRPPLSDLLA